VRNMHMKAYKPIAIQVSYCYHLKVKKHPLSDDVNQKQHVFKSAVSCLCDCIHLSLKIAWGHLKVNPTSPLHI
jgi:hypothetical protein